MGIFDNSPSRAQFDNLTRRVHELEAIVARLAGAAGIHVPPPDTDNLGLPPDQQGVVAEVRSLKLAGRNIEAIKVLRAATGFSLQEAKDAVDRL